MIEINDADSDATIKADDDDDGRGVRARLNAEVDGGNWGIQFGLAADFNADTEDVVYLYNAHGWSSILDMITIRAGQIDPGIWTVGGAIDENYASGLGVRLEVSPMEGLSLGAFIPFANPGPEVIADNFKDGTAFGFSYAQEGLFEASLAFKLYIADEWAFWNEEPVPVTPGDEEEDGKLMAGFGFYGVENLSLYLGLEFLHLISDLDLIAKIALNAGYDVTEQLNAALELVLHIAPIDDDDITLIVLDLKPGVTFAATEDFSLGAELPVALNFTKDAEVFLGIGLDLWGQYNIGNSYIKAGYGFAFTPEDYSDTGDSFVDHYIRLLFGYSF